FGVGWVGASVVSFFFQAEDGIRDKLVTGVQTCALPILTGERRRGRGAVTNPSGRYEPHAKIAFDDGWQSLEELPPFKTYVTEERSEERRVGKECRSRRSPNH